VIVKVFMIMKNIEIANVKSKRDRKINRVKKSPTVKKFNQNLSKSTKLETKLDIHMIECKKTSSAQ